MVGRNSGEGRVAAAMAGTALVLHLGPAVTGLAGVRTRIFPGLAGVGRPETIAVTFDDGPDPATTPRFLEKLRELGWRATFFMLGGMARQNASLAQEVAAAGHDVGLHGDEHRNLLFRGPLATSTDLNRGFEAITQATGRLPRWFRPPYGILTGDALFAARRLGLRTVLWTAWGRDWRAAATPQSIVTDVRGDLTPGGTVLLHDTSVSGSWTATLESLPALDEIIRGLGASPARLSEHLARPASVSPRRRDWRPGSPRSGRRPPGSWPGSSG
jgi:peptidoglycan/xylan/chitin deacetylase (PgdA/CDA1 family)